MLEDLFNMDLLIMKKLGETPRVAVGFQYDNIIKIYIETLFELCGMII